MSVRRIAAFVALVTALATVALTASPATADPATAGNQFVKQAGPSFRLHGREFKFAGTNNYYLMYSSRTMTDAVLDKAATNGFNVVRTWGWYDRGLADGSQSISGTEHGVYFQYWDPTTQHPAYNDGADGLQRLDYVVAAARERGLRLIIPLTNNWGDFGGMDQYVRYREL